MVAALVPTVRFKSTVVSWLVRFARMGVVKSSSSSDSDGSDPLGELTITRYMYVTTMRRLQTISDEANYKIQWVVYEGSNKRKIPLYRRLYTCYSCVRAVGLLHGITRTSTWLSLTRISIKPCDAAFGEVWSSREVWEECSPGLHPKHNRLVNVRHQQMKTSSNCLLINSKKISASGWPHIGRTLPSDSRGFVLLTHRQVFNTMMVAQNRKKRTVMARVNLRRTDEGEITRMVEYSRLMRAALVKSMTSWVAYEGQSHLPHSACKSKRSRPTGDKCCLVVDYSFSRQCASVEVKERIVLPVSNETSWAMMNIIPQTNITAAHISSHQNRRIRNRKNNRKRVSIIARPSTTVEATGMEAHQWMSK